MARYDFDPDRSTVWISARSNVHPINSSTTGLEGFMEVEWSADGSVDLSSTPSAKISLPVDRLSSGNRFEDREMHKRIDARRYPTIEGLVLEISPPGSDGTYQVTGDVTFRGVTQRHGDALTIERLDERTVQLAGTSRFDIRDFGMEPPRVLVLRVEPEVEVRVDVIARLGDTAEEG